MMRCISLAAAALLLIGCNTTSPFVGRWTSENLPNEMVQDGVEQVEIRFGEEDSFVFTLKDAEGKPMIGGHGTWKQVAEDQATFETTLMDRPVRGTSHIMGEGELLATTERGIAVEFKRTETERE